MTRLKQSEEQSFQSPGDEQMDQFSIEESAGFGSDFSTNQQAGIVGKLRVARLFQNPLNRNSIASMI
jgi:hypothetical protein